MKQNWEYKKLGKVCEILDNKRKPVSKENRVSGIYPYYGATGIQDYVNQFIFNGDYLLIGEDGAKWGTNEKTAYQVHGKCWVNNHAHILKINDDVANISFMEYYFTWMDLKSFITGAIVQKLTQSALVSIPVPVPPILEQERIVAELDLLQGIIDKQKAQLKEYDTLAQSIFYDMFGDPVENENGWELRTLDEVCSKITDGTHDTPQRYNTGIRFITGKHIKPYLIDYEKSDYVTEEVHKEIYSRCNPEKGDVLYTNIGAGTGNAALNTVSYEFSMKNVALLKVLKDMIDGYYVEYFLNNEKIRKRIIENFSNGGAQSFLSLKSIAKIPILLPPLSLQQQFAEKIEAIEHQKTLIKKSIEETQKLFDYTMDKYFG